MIHVKSIIKPQLCVTQFSKFTDARCTLSFARHPVLAKLEIREATAAREAARNVLAELSAVDAKSTLVDVRAGATVAAELVAWVAAALGPAGGLLTRVHAACAHTASP